MNINNILRIIILVCLIFLAQLQITISKRTQNSTIEKIPIQNYEVRKEDVPFDLYFPLINKSAPQNEVENAEKHLKLPIWSNGYLNCDSEGTEVSCYEIVRASKSIKKYEKIIAQGNTKGQVYVDAKPYPLEDRMVMLFHAFEIGITTNREVYVDKSLFPFQLPDIIKDSKGKVKGIELPSDYQFGCADISAAFPNVLIANVSWPLSLYTHHIVAPFLRNNFGFHAAYFIGSYLYGTNTKPDDCVIEETDDVIEAHIFPLDREMMRLFEYPGVLSRCGIQSSHQAVAITNSQDESMHNNQFQRVELVDDEDQNFVCNLRRMVSAGHLTFTFGSRYGFWGAAMNGKKGGYVNGIDKICVNVSNSQCGSLWHTFCPEDKHWIFRTNNQLFNCGPNANDVRLYLEYLLW